jgi:hypothetical protein
VTVIPGGGSGWDEAPLDIQIPDDARELDRDVLAYHRELRAQRRKHRLHRLTSPFAGRGTVMPLLASILAVCLVAGAMLSVATFSPASTAPADHTTRPSAPARAVSPSPPRSRAATTPVLASPSGPGPSLNSTRAVPSTAAGTEASSPATKVRRSASTFARSTAAPSRPSPGAIRPSALSSSFASAQPSSAAPR